MLSSLWLLGTLSVYPQLNSAVNLMYKPRYLDRNVLETESLTTEDGVYFLRLLYQCYYFPVVRFVVNSSCFTFAIDHESLQVMLHRLLHTILIYCFQEEQDGWRVWVETAAAMHAYVRTYIIPLSQFHCVSDTSQYPQVYQYMHVYYMSMIVFHSTHCVSDLRFRWSPTLMLTLQLQHPLNWKVQVPAPSPQVWLAPLWGRKQ